jgi:ComF family protein
MMSITKDMGLRLLALLLPPACLSCHRVEGVSSLTLGLCGRCHRELDFQSKSTNGAFNPCPSALDDLLSRWTYAPPFDAVIHALKFGRLEFLGEDLADGLHDELLEAKELEVDVVVPIPLHWHRRLARGYNQAEAIARPLADRLDRPMVSALRRRRATRPQAQLGKHQRGTNMSRAFRLRTSHSVAIVGRRVLLVDDVVTTGATLQAAAECLRQAGSDSILGLVAGRTPAARGRRGAKLNKGGVGNRFDNSGLNSLY